MDFTALVEMFLQVVEERRLARLGAELQRFADALDAWLHDLLAHPRPDWREQWQAFLVWQEAEGRRPTPESQQSVVQFLETWAQSIGLESASGERELVATSTEVGGERASANSKAKPESQQPGGYPEAFGPLLGAMEEERRSRSALAMPPLVDEPPPIPDWQPRIVEIKQVKGIWSHYDELLAAGRYDPHWLQRAFFGFAREIHPESEPSTRITFDDGTVLILLGGGPDSGALAGQAAFILGARGAVSGGMTLKQALAELAKYAGRETVEGVASGVTGLPVGSLNVKRLPSGIEPVKPKIRRNPLHDMIEGTAQKTGSKGHAFRINREAIKMARSGRYDKIWLNRAYSTTTGTKTIPRRLPDIIGRRKTGEFDAIEVPSTSDKEVMLRGRNVEAMNQLPIHQRGRVRLKRIRSTEK